MLTRAVSQSLASIVFHRNEIGHFRQFAPTGCNLNDYEGVCCMLTFRELRGFGCGWYPPGVLWNPITYPCTNIVNYPKSDFTIQIFQSIVFNIKTSFNTPWEFGGLTSVENEPPHPLNLTLLPLMVETFFNWNIYSLAA